MFHWSVRLRGPQIHNRTAVTVRHYVYCFGGDRRGDEDETDVHVFDTVSLTWRMLTPVTSGRERHLEVPPRLCGHTAVLIEDIAYTCGGYSDITGMYSNNMLHAFDVDGHRWVKSQVSGTRPGGDLPPFSLCLGEGQSWGPLLKEVIHYILHTTFEKGNALLYLITPWRQ